MSVHIKISDRNWILETMAKNISSRLDYVRYDTEADPSAKIQYYLTYSTFKGRVSDVEIAYFTHLEEDPATAKRFFDTAAAVDCCVSMSHLYARMLKDRGIEQVEIIPPGVDTAAYEARLRIGVVGRTYSTGRKGEGLVASVMDLEGIDWFFTGDGWPGPALNLADAQMPDFYRSLDYVLVPARYEGGPMSAIEAIACGVEVIAPPVGWMEELPHIPYRLNDAGDLKRVLTGLLEKKRNLRSAVLDRTWDAFAEKHDSLFRRLVPDAAALTRKGTARPRQARISLVTHGMEEIAKGGPTTRIPQLRAGLAAKGFVARQGNIGTVSLKDADLYHLFNVATPPTATAAMAGIKSFGKPVVFSPIYLDNRCRMLWSKTLPEIFAASGAVDPHLPELERLHSEARQIRQLDAHQAGTLPASYFQKLAALLQNADELIFLSRYERDLLAGATGLNLTGRIIKNPVDAQKFRNGDPAAFSQVWGVKDYVLCVGRIEPRKNQLLLAAALSGTGIPLVLVGDMFDPGYANKIRSIPDLTVIFTGRIEEGSPLLSSAFAGARVFCLPSWSEGAPISALEAGAAGCNMVLSTYSGESEYFSGRARFADPSDFSGLKATLLEAYNSSWTKADRETLSEFTAQEYSIERHVRETAEVYEGLLSKHAAPSAATAAWGRSTAPELASSPAGQTVYFDVTTLLNNPGRITGITRVELSLTRVAKATDNVVFVAWHDRYNSFFKVPDHYLDFNIGPSYREDPLIVPISDVETGAPLFVQGNAWLGNFAYVCALEGFVRANRLRLTLHVHDILPISHRQFFDEPQRERLVKHLQRLMPMVSAYSADSEATKHELEDYLGKYARIPSETRVIRLADDIDAGTVPVQEQKVGDAVARMIAQKNYVLSVGSQSPHKNRDMVIKIWERLLEEKGAGTPHLVIVGKSHAQSPDHPISPKLKHHVHFLTSATDFELLELYRNCLFTIFPSLCEGWGLPISESLSYGKVCIACDASSMKEIAPRVTDLIDPLDMMAWYKRVKLYAFSPLARERREAEIAAGFQPRHWRETLTEMLETARTAPSAVFADAAWDLDVPFDFANYDHVGKLGVVHRPQSPTAPAEFELSLSLAGVTESHILMDILCASTGQGLVEVLVNDVVVDKLILLRAPERVHSVILPVSAFLPGARLVFREAGNVGFKPYKFILRNLHSRTTALPGRIEIPPLVLSPDTLVETGAGEPLLQRLAMFGWHSPEQSGVWSKEDAWLRLPPANQLSGDIRIDLSFSVFATGWIFFRIGSDFVQAVNIADTATRQYSIVIPERVVLAAGSYIDLRITHMSARSPASSGISTDPRVLGICLRSVSYSVLPAQHQPVTSGMFDGEQFVSGWHPREQGHIWSSGTGYIRLPSSRYRGESVSFRMTSLADIEVLAFLQGEYVTSTNLMKLSPGEIRLDIPADLNTEFLDVALVPSSTVIPREIGMNADGRKLGICLHRIAIVHAEPTPLQGKLKKGRTKLTRIGSKIIDVTMRDRRHP